MKNLKQVIAFILLVVLTVSSIACSSGGQAQPSTSEVPNLQASSQQQPESKSSYVNKDPDFRNVNWGMSKEEVKLYETESLAEEDTDTLLYYVEVLNLEAALMYFFNENNELYEAGYLFTEDYTNDNMYLIHYDNVKEELITLYGTPTSDEEFWLNDLFRDDPNDYGLAVSIGDYFRFAEWKLDGMDIILGLGGGNYDINMSVGYTSTRIPAPETDSGL